LQRRFQPEQWTRVDAFQPQWNSEDQRIENEQISQAPLVPFLYEPELGGELRFERLQVD
jgi:hypothetical protein